MSDRPYTDSDRPANGGDQAVAPEARQRGGRWRNGDLSARVADNLVPALLLAAVVLGLSLSLNDFFSRGNLLAALQQFGEIGFVTVGMLIVVAVGGIDLSVGGIFALCTFAALLFVQYLEWPVGLSIAAVLAVGGLLGAFNGVLIGYLRLRAFLTTLISIVIFRAIFNILSSNYGGPITAKFPESEFWNYLAFAEVFGIALPFWLCILVAIAVHFVLTRFRIGWHVMASGGSRRAAHNAGIPVARTVMLCYVASGVLTAIGSVFSAARLGDLGFTVGLGLEVKVLTGIIAGGVALGGGRGSVTRALLGLLIVLLLINGLTEMSVQAGIISIALAALLIFAAILENVLTAGRQSGVTLKALAIGLRRSSAGGRDPSLDRPVRHGGSEP